MDHKARTTELDGDEAEEDLVASVVVKAITEAVGTSSHVASIKDTATSALPHSHLNRWAYRTVMGLLDCR